MLAKATGMRDSIQFKITDNRCIACGMRLRMVAATRQAMPRTAGRRGSAAKTRLADAKSLQQYYRVTDVILFPEFTFCGVGLSTYFDRNATIDDEDLTPLGQLTFAKKLRLDYTRLTDRGMESISSLQRLENLSLDSTKITDAGLAPLAKLRSLKTLNLCNTAITDAGLVHLAEIRSLKYVFLDGTQVTPEGMRKLKQALPSLKTTSFDDQLDLQDFSPL
jgi:Leucine-rich repeat (LRR) protein